MKVKIGDPADRVVREMRRRGVKASRPPKEIGRDRNGLIVEWYLPRMVLTFKRVAIGGTLEYRVTDVRSSHAKDK